jgi:organic hydroperoxide reductase OsmC/OhrA
MQAFPHTYAVATSAQPTGDVVLTSDRLEPLATAAPAEFGGPGDKWSPETMLVGTVANCFVLTFRAIAAASKLAWTSVAVDVQGTLDRIDRVTRFTAFTIDVKLDLPPGVGDEQAHRLLVKAEETCLITRSLNAPVDLRIDVRVAEPVA